MTTSIATWGNSEAVRLPKGILAKVGLSAGDVVDLVVDGDGRIVIVPEKKAHRKVAAKEGVTAASLFSGYTSDRYDASGAWPSNELVGAERDAWSN